MFFCNYLPSTRGILNGRSGELSTVKSSIESSSSELSRKITDASELVRASPPAPRHDTERSVPPRKPSLKYVVASGRVPVGTF